MPTTPQDPTPAQRGDDPFDVAEPEEALELPDPPAEPQLVRVRVDLDGSQPKIWRRLELRSDLSVDELHQVLQAAMGWDNSHLHRFWVGPLKRIWDGPHLLTDFDMDEGEQGLAEWDAQVGQVLRAVGDRIVYSYDFGDDWTHTIKVEALQPLPEGAPRAVCTGGRGAGPTDDIGGVGSHNDLVACWREAPDRSTMDEMYAEWLPPDWDPTHFSPEEATEAIEAWGTDPDDLDPDDPDDPDLPPLAGAVPVMHPAVLDLWGRAHPGLAAELTRVTTWSGEHTTYLQDGPGLEPHPLARAVRPWQLLLEIAGTEGIPLTAAGWMKPAVVQEIFDELGLGRDWIGTGNREDLTLPVRLLRESAQRTGLLRKSKGRLLATTTARAMTRDDAALWAHLAARILPTRAGFERDAAVLWLVAVAVDGQTERVSTQDLARWLTDLGWRTSQGGDVLPMHVPDGVRSVAEPVSRISRVRGRGQGDPVVARAFARQALLGGSS